MDPIAILKQNGDWVSTYYTLPTRTTRLKIDTMLR